MDAFVFDLLMIKIYSVWVMTIKKLKTLKFHTFLKKNISCSKCGNEDKKIFKGEESI